MTVLHGFKKLPKRPPPRLGTGKYPWASMSEGDSVSDPSWKVSTIVSSVGRWNWLNKGCLRVVIGDGDLRVIWPIGGKHISRKRK